MENKRPTGHRKNVTGSGKSVYRRGNGLGTGPVTDSRPNNFGSQTHQIQETGRKPSGRNVKRGGGALSILAIAALLLFGGNDLFGGSDQYESTPVPVQTSYISTPAPTPKPTSTPRPTANIDFGISPGSFQTLTEGNSSQTVVDTNTETPDTTVSAGAREKYTVIRGDGSDKITVMIYMCGTDLESRSSMATRDLVEMTKANFSNNVRILV